MPAKAEMKNSTIDKRDPRQLGPTKAWQERFVPFFHNTETLHADGKQNTVYENKGGSRTRKILGEGMVWGGGIYGIYNLVTLDIPGALVGGAVHIAGRWVRPKPQQ